MKSATVSLRVAFLIFALLHSASVFAQEAEGNGVVIKLNPDGTGEVLANPNNVPVPNLSGITVNAYNVMTGEIINRDMFDNTLTPQVAQKLAEQFNAIVLGKPLDDPDRGANLQAAFDDAKLEDIKIKLNASDNEWAVLLPRIKKLIAAKQNLPSNRDFTDKLLNQTPARKLAAQLKTLVDNSNSPAVAITASLKEYRQASRLAHEEYLSTEKAVLEVLTLRQEAVLVHMGYLK